MSAGRCYPGDLFGGDSSNSDSSEASVASLGADDNTAGDPLANATVNDDDDGKDPGSAAAVGGAASEEGGGADTCAGESGACSGAGDGGIGGVLDQAVGAEEKEAAAGAAGGGGGSRPRKTLPRMDPEEALRAFAESIGMSVDALWRGVTGGDGGEIVEIDWSWKDLKGTLPVGDMHMPYLRKLVLDYNRGLKGEARGVGVAVVKFTDCFCVNELASLYPYAAVLSLLPSSHTSLLLSPFAGDIGTLVVPEGMLQLYLTNCSGLTGDIGTLVLPEGMQGLNLSRCSGLTGDIGTLVLPEGMQDLLLYDCHGLTGDIGTLVVPEGMQRLLLTDCTGLTGKAKG
jgi:hypothetical protein